MQPTSKKPSLGQLALLAGLLAFLIPLGVYAYTGVYTRYWADDYCYNASLRIDGFWMAQVRFYQHTSDRYSVIPLVGISELFGQQAIRIWPALAILLALNGLAWLFKQIARAAGIALDLVERVLFSAVVIFFTLWQAPNLFQALFWRTGMLTYFMPLIANFFLAGLILHWALSRHISSRQSLVPLLLVFLLALVAGGFSETTAALQASTLVLALLFSLWAAWSAARKGAAVAFARSASVLLVVALLGTLLAIVALFVSPSNQLRLVHMPESAPLPVVVTTSLQFGLDFLRDTFSSQPLPTLISLLAGVALGMAWAVRAGNILDTRRVVVTLAGVLLSMYILIVSVCAPSVYVEVAYPEPRALIAARLVMVLGLVTTGWLAGILALSAGRRLRFSAILLRVPVLLLLLLVSLYALRAAYTFGTHDLPFYRQRAAEWDARDLEIRQLASQGQVQVQVRALDSIAGLMDLQADPGIFPNTCVAGAYGLWKITGINP